MIKTSVSISVKLLRAISCGGEGIMAGRRIIQATSISTIINHYKVSFSLTASVGDNVINRHVRIAFMFQHLTLIMLKVTGHQSSYYTTIIVF